jgi:hypothetical protein
VTSSGANTRRPYSGAAGTYAGGGVTGKGGAVMDSGAGGAGGAIDGGEKG